MPILPGSYIRYSEPDLVSLRNDGYYPVDMHLHTRHSDGLSTIPSVIRHAKKHGIGVAITDHNEISGVLEAISRDSDLLVVPGIELETREGPHILVYFYTPGDLQDFFSVFNRERTRMADGLTRNLPVSECLILAEPFDCLRVAAHPYGYFGINRGVLKCVEKKMLPGVMNHIDGIEVICGGMIERLNRRAIHYAQTHPVPVTGGSDAHILDDIGTVVTGVRAGTVEEFLTGIRKRENVVMGKSSGYMRKGATAGVIAWSFVPYTVSWVTARYSVHKGRRSHLLSRYRERFYRFGSLKNENGESSEERGEES